jgi:predicted anti-sigma-YlaC factor YlaD
VVDPAVEGHLASCEGCRRYVELMGQIAGALDELHEATEAVEATRSLEPLVHPVRRPRRKWQVVAGRITAMAAAVVVAVCGWVYFGDGRWSARQEAVELVGGGERPAGDLQGAGIDDAAAHRVGVSLAGESVGRYLVVGEETAEPDVQMYWLYPTVAPRADTESS